MVNRVLCGNAIICSFVHIWAFSPASLPLWYNFFVAACVSTSILNHGLTRDFIKWSDRALMFLGLPLTLMMSPCLKHGLLLAATVVFYIIGKIKRSTWPHAVSHWGITFINANIAISHW
jgi:hypothetical protein